MMDRRLFLRRAALIAAGAVAADQLELLEKLTHVRRLFPAADVRVGGVLTEEMLNRAIHRIWDESFKLPEIMHLHPNGMVEFESTWVGRRMMYAVHPPHILSPISAHGLLMVPDPTVRPGMFYLT